MVLPSLFSVKQNIFSHDFILGVINGYSAEYNAMKFAVNTSSGVNNVSLILKNFNITNETNLVNQGKIQNL